MSTLDYEAYRQAKEQIAQLEAEMAEFQASSRDLERELELELEESEERHKNSQNKINTLTAELEQWKEKHKNLQKEYAVSQASLQREISTLQKAHKEANNQLREIEMTNDNMEQLERITKSTLEDMEQNYYNSLEQIAMLEAELSGRDDMKIELQRAKDELRDTIEELSVANGKLEVLVATNQGNYGSSSLGTNKENRAPELLRKSSRLTFHHSKGIPENAVVTSNNTDSMEIPYISHLHAKSPTNRLSSSRSLRKIHGMLDQMKSLENRVANFKSSLPKPITPTKLSTQLPSSPPSRPSSRMAAQNLDAAIDIQYSTQSSANSSNSYIPVPRFRMNQDQFPPVTSQESFREEQKFLSSSSSSRNKRHSLSIDMCSSGRPRSPQRYYDDTNLHRSQSAAGNHSPERHLNLSVARVPNDVFTEAPPSTSDSQAMHDSKRLGGSSQGSKRTESTKSKLPKARHSVDSIQLSNLSVTEAQAPAPTPHPSAALLYAQSSRSSGLMGPPVPMNSIGHHHDYKPKSKPSISGFDFSNQFYYPSHHAAGSAASVSTSSLTSQNVGKGSGGTGSTNSRPGSTFGMLHSRQPLGHGRLA